MERLAPIFPASRLWVVTNDEQAARFASNCRAVRAQHPRRARRAQHRGGHRAGRGSSAARIQRRCADGRAARRPIHRPGRALPPNRASRAAKSQREPGALVVLGIPPTRPETGYGYIERAKRAERRERRARLRRPALHRKARARAGPTLCGLRPLSLERGDVFLARLDAAATISSGICRRPTPRCCELAETIGTPRYAAALRRIYPQLENISVDYAVLEPASRDPKRSPVFVLPAAVGWSDIGSWAAVYELLARRAGENVSAGRHLALDAARQFSLESRANSWPRSACAIWWWWRRPTRC